MPTYDPKSAGAYIPTEAAHYLRVPISTLRAWVFGQSYGSRRRKFQSVIEIDDIEDRLLSFNNLIEVHVLAGIRKVHDIPLPTIRRGLNFVEQKLKTERPLLNQKFSTDGLDLFVESSGILLNVTRDGQLPFRDIMETYLRRIERDPRGVPIRLYPFSRHAGREDARKIVIDPQVAFGRPTLIGTSVPTSNIFERFLAGEPVGELASDFRVEQSFIEEAIRCEQVATAA